ncbi:MAG: HEPN domain-containing protein [Dehalococcoidia bacterium]
MKRPYKAEPLRWLTQAKDEFEDSEELRKRRRFYLALFHFQQATEKAFKAYLHLKVKSAEVFHTHSVNELAKMAVEIDSDFKKVASAKRLDRYHIPTRYPNGLPGGIPSRYFDDAKEAKKAMQQAKSAIDLIARKLEED